MIPFINFLYQAHFQRQKQTTKDPFNKLTPIFDYFHKHKAGVPIGGGILIIATTLAMLSFFLFLFFLFNVPIISGFKDIKKEAVILFFTPFAFGLLGFYDDWHKIFNVAKKGFFGLRMRHKLIIELLVAFIIGLMMYVWLGINFIHIPFVGVIPIGPLYIVFAVFVIVAFANAYNITDGLDGLSSGVLLISLITFWVISSSSLDTLLSVFIAIWVGGLLTFLYFNVYPARIMLGDTGALAFGATFAVIGLLLGKALLLPLIGMVFVAEISTSFIQLLSKKFLKKKFFPVAPLHLYLQLKKWEEPKIVNRLWLVTIICSFIGLWIAFIK
ncbi:MAG: hypothetical protein WC775_01735 [Patescibacteria group bacterium]|jgi:phospho-N-acetylmuramoyl-pentapeptide-transferase